MAALERASGEGRLPALRTFARDRDIDIAENALRMLNSSLRLTLPVVVADDLWEVRLAKAGVHVLHVVNGSNVVLGVGYGIVDETRVVGFDLVTRDVTWTYATRGGVRSNAVRVRDHLYFVSDDRVIHSISIDGKPRWAKPLTPRPDLGTTGPAITASGDRLFVADGESIYVVNLSGAIEAHAMGDDVSRHLVQGRRKVFGAIHNGPLLVLDGSASPKRSPTALKTAAVSAGGDVVCIVSFGPAYQLQCLDQETLRELWRVDLPNEVGAYNRLEQDAENVYVLAQGRALAFKISDGTRRWATNEFTSGAFFKSFGRAALTRNSDFELEWRDPASGEIIGVWGKRERGFADDAVLIGEALLVETRDSDQGDGLRLLRLPDTIGRRLTAR